jgi:SRSO17 transposase
VTTTDLEAAAASTVEEALLACGKLDELMGGLAGCFGRVEPRREARKYITGLISDLPRKNCWALAERAGDQTPDKMQRLLERAAWDAFASMRVAREFVVAGLSDPAEAVLVVDESGQEKAGEHTAGVQRQYLGCAGRVANGINVVYAGYAAPAGHAVIAARLYVPASWANDSERRRTAGIPHDLEFKTKPQLAAEILEEVIAEGRCPPWVTGDEVYGRDAKLRSFLEARRTGYVLKIPCSFRVTLPTGQKVRADHAARLVPATGWQTASAGHGSKGERDYSWAWLATASTRHHLLIRASLTDPADRGLFLLPRAVRVGLLLHHPDPRRRAALADRGGLRPRQELFRAGRQPGPPLHPHRPAPGPGHGRACGLRHHRRLSTPPHQHPGPAAHLTP